MLIITKYGPIQLSGSTWCWNSSQGCQNQIFALIFIGVFISSILLYLWLSEKSC